MHMEKSKVNNELILPSRALFMQRDQIVKSGSVILYIPYQSYLFFLPVNLTIMCSLDLNYL